MKMTDEEAWKAIESLISEDAAPKEQKRAVAAMTQIVRNALTDLHRIADAVEDIAKRVK
jgi:hypothetical protein